MTSKLTHFDPSGQAHMVDISAKKPTHRVAVARGCIRVKPKTLTLIAAGSVAKGDVLGVARIAAIQGAKKTSELVPLCHPISLTRVAVDFVLEKKPSQVICTATVETVGLTGVEMEALVAVHCALLTIYDMCKAVDLEMVCTDIRLTIKQGGKREFMLGA